MAYFLNIIYAFLLGYYSQVLVFHFIKAIKYSYNQKFFMFLKITTGIMYSFLWIQYDYSYKFLIYIIASSILMCLAFIDSEHMLIPDEFSLILLFLGITNLMVNINNPNTFVEGLLVGGAIFLLIAIVTNGGMGGGDIKLMACIGFIMGVKATLYIILLTFILSGFGTIYVLIRKGLKLKESIPYGPYISATTLMYFLMIG